MTSSRSASSSRVSEAGRSSGRPPPDGALPGWPTMSYRKGLASSWGPSMPDTTDPDLDLKRLAGAPLDVPATETLAYEVYRYAGLLEKGAAGLDPTSASAAASTRSAVRAAGIRAPGRRRPAQAGASPCPRGETRARSTAARGAERDAADPEGQSSHTRRVTPRSREMACDDGHSLLATRRATFHRWLLPRFRLSLAPGGIPDSPWSVT